MKRFLSAELVFAITAGVSVNLSIGALVSAIRLPLFLDSIGTIIITCTSGLAQGIAVGVLSVIIGSTYIPTLWAYAGTAIAIAIYTRLMISIGYLHMFWPTVFGGLGLGLVTAVVSAPVTSVVWGGVSLSGSDALTLLFIASGKSISQSVLYAGIGTDPIDKMITSLVAYSIIKRLPSAIFKR